MRDIVNLFQRIIGILNQENDTSKLGPREFLRQNNFSPEKAHKLYPNARRLTLGGLFVSHTGIDTDRIKEEIISPVVYKLLPNDGYFLHNIKWIC